MCIICDTIEYIASPSRVVGENARRAGWRRAQTCGPQTRRISGEPITLVGVPPDAQKRIFSLFYTTKPGGTGVGLAMAFRVVQLHNGTIDFTSEVNRGTTFRVTLPAGAQQEPQPEAQ
jgi:light-regulated signal transduction histidine kinase (bacteriophytochrome)